MLFLALLACVGRTASATLATPTPELVVVSAGNAPYGPKVLAALLVAQDMAKRENIDARFVAYDLGGGWGTCGGAAAPVWAEKGIEYRAFDGAKYPAHVLRLKCFAWKAPVIAEVAREHPDGTAIAWLDSGIGIGGKKWRNALANAHARGGFASTVTSRGVPRFSHETTVAYFVTHYGLDEAIAADILDRRKRAAAWSENRNTSFQPNGLDGPLKAGARLVNCNGAFSVHVVGSPMYRAVFERWVECSLVEDCVCPPGSNLENHRQDQAALTLLAITQNHSCQEDVKFGTSHGMGNGRYKPFPQILAEHGVSLSPNARGSFCKR